MHMKLARLLLLLVLAFTIPVQGLAAATAGLCMSLGHHGWATAAPHDHGTDHESGVAESHADQSAEGAHCAPCVACCGAASIAPATAVFIPDRRPAIAIAGAPPAFAGVLPHQLDRPPLAL